MSVPDRDLTLATAIEAEIADLADSYGDDPANLAGMIERRLAAAAGALLLHHEADRFRMVNECKPGSPTMADQDQGKSDATKAPVDIADSELESVVGGLKIEGVEGESVDIKKAKQLDIGS
jgi:hypothetical protein